MSKARGLADLGNAFDDGALSNRNLIINGAMQVAQRGTSQTASGYGSVDRMALSLSGATASMTQESLTLGQTDLPSQFRKFARIATTTGNNNCGLYHRIEDVDTAEGQVTLSFYAKGTNPASGSFEVYLYQSFGSGGSAGVITTTESLTLTSSWQRFEFAFTLASLSGKTIGTGSSIELDIVQPNADTGTSAWTLDFTGVQLEVGDTATPFEHRSYGDELARCQRYFERWNFPVTFDWYVTSTAASDHDVECPYNGAFAVAKRATPTYSRSGTFNVSNLASNDWTARPTTNSITFYNGASAAGRYYSYNDTSAYLDFDAEL